MFRNPSAIYIWKNGHGLLMDSAEGSYSQLWDHFKSKELLDKIIRKTNFIFITHLHGDHQLGVLKMISERDKLLERVDPKDKLYVMIPSPMMEWMKEFV